MSRFISLALASWMTASAALGQSIASAPPAPAAAQPLSAATVAEAYQNLPAAADGQLAASAAAPYESEGVTLDSLVTPVAALCGPAASKPKYPTIVVSGCAQIDGVWLSQSDANELVVGDGQDEAGFRRSRLGVKGNLAENVAYQMEYDFAFPGRPNFTNVYADVAELPLIGHFQVGQWKQPFSMEPATSYRELMFMERSLAFALVPFRQIGAGVHNAYFDDSMTFALSGYRFPTDQFGNASGDAGYGFTTRTTALVWDNGDGGDTVHIGGGYSRNDPATKTLRLRSTPEVGFTQLDFRNTTDFPIPFFVDSGLLSVDNYQVLGGEFAFGVGSLAFQSEVVYGAVNQLNGPYYEVPAGYIQAGYVWTGERRAYNKQTAAYGRVIPANPFGKGGAGAWETCFRYSTLDLNDANIQGGRLQDYTAGVNWYLNQYTRFEMNYIHAALDRPVGNNTDADVFGVRAQLDF